MSILKGVASRNQTKMAATQMMPIHGQVIKSMQTENQTHV